MWNTIFPWVRRVVGQRSEGRPHVAIKRGVREELLVLIDGHLAGLTHPDTLSALQGAGLPPVRELCHVLRTGTTEARLSAGWLLGQIGAEAAIPGLRRVLEGASGHGEPPVVLRCTTDALLRLGPAGIQAFHRAIRLFPPDDLTRLLLICHATEQLLSASSVPPVPRQTTRAWLWDLTVYLRRLERLARINTADILSVEHVVLEAYGVSLAGELGRVPNLIEALTRYPAPVPDEVRRAS